MEKFYKLLSPLLLIWWVGGYAQQQASVHSDQTEGRNQIEACQNTHGSIFNSTRATMIYSEEFNGSLPAGWQNNVIAGPAGFPGWEWTLTGGAYGGQLNSTTASNGYMILDSDAHGSTGFSEEADLISPPIDCSSATTSIFMSLEHYARTFGAADISIFISNDNFSTQTLLYNWSGAPANAGNGSNPVISQFDITAIATGQNNVKLKFKWIGEYDYWWLIDDIKIYAASSYNLSMLNPNGSGTVIPAPGVTQHPEGTIVSISALPDFGNTFQSWSGEVANPNASRTTVSMTKNLSIQANFAAYTDDLLWHQYTYGTSANNSAYIDDITEYEVADNFSSSGIEDIRKIVVEGLPVGYNIGATQQFIVRFYDEPATSEPDWANPVIVQTIDALPYYVEVLSWNSAYLVYRYELNLTTPVVMQTGWVSVQNSSGSFYWLRSTEGNGNGNSWHRILGEPSNQLAYDMMLELWGTAALVPPSCVEPVFPADGADNVPGITSLTWNTDANATGYLLYYGETLPENGIDVGNVSSYPVSLSYSTLYRWRVVPYNDSGEATGCPVWSFTTQADPTITTFPWTETFEDGSPSRASWTQIQETGSGLWSYASGSSGGLILTAYAGDLNARFVSTSGTNSPITKLVSPPLDLTSITNPRLVFYYGQESWFGDQNTLKVYYRAGGTSPWTELVYLTDDISAWAEYIVALPNKSAAYQIAFEGINNYGRANVIDQVTVQETPLSVLSWYNLQWPPTATIALNENVSVYAQCWEPGVTPGAGPGDGIECWIGISSSDTDPSTWGFWVPAPYNTGFNPESNNDEYFAEIGNAQGLAPGTYYYASRFRYLGGPFTYGGTGGPWDGAASVSGILTVTPCNAYTVPFSEDFEVSSPTLPCWLSYNADGGGTAWALSTIYNNTPGGQRSALHSYGDISYDEDGWLVSPPVSIPSSGQVDLAFWSYNTYPDDYGKNSVLISTGSGNPDDGEFVEIWSPAVVAGSWTETILSLATYAGQNIFIAFRYEGNFAHGWYLDDVFIGTLAPPVKSLNLKAYIEGFWNGSAMNQAQDVDEDENIFNKFNGTTVDTLSVYLAEADAPWAYLFAAHEVNINTDGSMVISVPAAFPGSYYIVIDHHSSVETWSALPVDFSGTTIDYDFTTAAGQAYGSNQQSMGTVWALYSGDVNDDEYIEFLDVVPIYNLSAAGFFGYTLFDIDGNGYIEFLDYIIAYNNSVNSVGMNTPPNPAKRPGTSNVQLTE